MLTPKKYRKKPVEIEAMLFTGRNANEIARFVGDGVVYSDVCDFYEIETLEGDMHARPGDFIIKGVQGEFYPCKPDIFAQTYEEVNDSDPSNSSAEDGAGVAVSADDS